MKTIHGNGPELERQYSILLDLVRFVAAVTVFLSHASYVRISGAVLPNLTKYGGDAVTLFFVLSGFVISYTSQTKDPDLVQYLISRVARLWSVAIPALVLSVVLSHYGFPADPALYLRLTSDEFGSNHYLAELVGNLPILRFLFGLFFVNEAFSIKIIEFYNAPYWSLSYEFCYYLIFGIFYYVKSGWKYPAILLVSAIFGPKILLLFPVWLMGVALHRWQVKVPPGLAWPCILGSAATYAAASAFELARYAWWPDHFMPFPLHWSDHFAYQYFLGIVIGINLIGLRSLPDHAVILRLERPIRRLSAKTLSLYLFHFPILFFLAARIPGDWHPILRAILIIVVTPIAVDVLSRPTEAQKGRWRTGLVALVSVARFGRLVPRRDDVA